MRLILSNNTKNGNGRNKHDKPLNVNGNPTSNLAFVRAVRAEVVCWQERVNGKIVVYVEALVSSNPFPEDGRI